MKTTYLVNQEQPDGSVRLEVVSSREWLSVVERNKHLPADQQRYFILDYIMDGDVLDCMVIETSAADYRDWNRKRLAARRNRKAEKNFQHLSIDAPLGGLFGTDTLADVLASEEQVEVLACDQILLDELHEALALWKPWANDLLDMYLQGKKRTCTRTLAERYGVSPQVVRKYKRQFEEYIKNFL